MISNYLVILIEVCTKASWAANNLKNVVLIHGIAQPNLIHTKYINID